MADETKYEESELYDGRVKVRFYPQSHMYYVSVDGGKFTRKKGVSTISGVLDKSRALQSWQQQITAEFLLNKIQNEENIGHNEIIEAIAQCDVKKDEAAGLGTTIHEFISTYILHKMGKGPMPGEPTIPEVAKALEAFLEWESQNKVKYHDTEKIVYSIKHDYIGCMDLDVTINGKRALVDFKSSNGLYNSVIMQTMGYAMANEEEQGKDLYDERWAIRVSKYSEEEYYKKERQKKELKQFIAKLQGREPKDYPIKPYQVFEAKLLASSKKEHTRDKKAFLNALALMNWNSETDFYSNP